MPQRLGCPIARAAILGEDGGSGEVGSLNRTLNHGPNAEVTNGVSPCIPLAPDVQGGVPMHWVKWQFADWLNDTGELSPAETGALMKVRALILTNGGPVAFDPGRLAKRLNCPTTACEKLVFTLVELGKLTLSRGFLSCEFCALAIETAKAKRESASSSAAHRWSKNDAKSDSVRCEGNADAMLILESELDTPPAPPSGGLVPPSGEPKKREPRGSRIPEDFEPDLSVAVALGLSEQEAVNERAKFRDYWTSKPGAAGRKSDWPATWRNWCRSALERRMARKPTPGGYQPAHGGHVGAALRFAARLADDPPPGPTPFDDPDDGGAATVIDLVALRR